MTNKQLRMGLAVGTMGFAIGTMSMTKAVQAEGPSLFVYDSTGKLVGPLSATGLELYGEPGVVNFVLKGTKEPVSISVSITKLGIPVPTIYYITSDCSGAPYLNYLSARKLVKVAYLDPMQANSILFPDRSDPAVRLASYRDFRDSYKTCYSFGNRVLGFPARRTSLSGQGFTPPFSVKEQ